jgi:hypothetical protein
MTTIEKEIASAIDSKHKSPNDIEIIKEFEKASILFQKLLKTGLVKERGYTLTSQIVRSENVYSNLNYE